LSAIGREGAVYEIDQRDEAVPVGAAGHAGDQTQAAFIDQRAYPAWGHPEDAGGRRDGDDAEATKTIRAFHEVRAMATMDRRPGTAAVNAELRERATEVVERLRADGLSYAKCARALNEQGIEPLAGPDWTAEGVRNLVRVR